MTIEGRIHYTQWEDQSGAKRYGCEIIADKVDFLTKAEARAATKARPTSTRTEHQLPAMKAPVAHAIGAFFMLAGVERRCGASSPRTAAKIEVTSAASRRSDSSIPSFIDAGQAA